MKKKKSILIVLIIILILVLLYMGISIFFSSHFFINSTVNGIKSSWKSAAAVYDEIKEDAKSYAINIVDANGNVVETVKSSDIGFSVNYSEEDVAKLLKKQNGFKWVVGIFKPSEYETKKANSYNASMVQSTAEQMHIAGSGDTESIDAYVAFNSSTNEFIVEPELIGNIIDTDSVAAAIINAAENFDTEINIANGDCYKKPELTSDSPELIAACDKANKYLNTNITYDLGVTTDQADLQTKASWIKVEGTEVVFDEEAMGQFVDEMGKKYNTFGKSKTLVTTSGETVKVPAGSLGWKIAYQGEIDQIKADLEAGEDVTRDFTYLFTAASHGENDYGDSYVEVNLTDQHVYIYKDGNMVFDTACVTGNVYAGTDTHTGAYPIAYKAKNATLRGANYTSFVNYWMPFNNGEGLHDATWRSKFGGTIYQGGGSHGCVNLPLSAAKQIYEIVDEGWPVLVFYTGDTEAEIEAVRAPYIGVMTLIASIETVSLESEGKINEARVAYNALSDDLKAKVSNYDTLVAAEQALWELKAGIVQ